MSSFPEISPKGANRGPKYRTGWDLALLGSYRIPGRSRVLKGGIEVKVDPKRKLGAHGAKPTTHGLDLQDFELEVTVWTDEQLVEMDNVLATILPGPSGTSVPLAFDHPAIRSLRVVDFVLVLGASIWTTGDYGISSRKLTLKLKHWMPPSSRSATNTATQGVRSPDNARTAAAANPPPSTQQGAAGPPQFTQGT